MFWISKLEKQLHICFVERKTEKSTQTLL